MRHFFKIAGFISLLLALSGMSLAANVVSLVKNGGSANRVDLVILGDGYKSSELSKFATDADDFRTKFFAVTPYKEYAAYFNVTRIDTASQESGAGQGKAKNTVYGAFYNCFSVQRLLCVDDSKVTAVLSANLAANAHDMVIVIVNSSEYGGSGGTFAVASTNEFAGDIAIHEFGHSFGRLDDEYVDEFNCGRFTTPVGGFNVSKVIGRKTIPWKVWVDPSTPLPTPDSNTTDVGAFEGAFYCAKDWFRPTFNSMMNTLGVPLGPVNGEQIIRRIYQFSDPIDLVRPAPGVVKIGSGASKSFRVKVIDPALSDLKITWRLGDKVVGNTARVTIRSSMLAGKKRVLTVIVRDKTSMVRFDPNRVLLQSKTWTLTP